jgi:YD repeat-containing protein
VVGETAGAAGGVVRQVRDQTGRTIEVTLNAAGQVTATRVLQAAAPR